MLRHSVRTTLVCFPENITDHRPPHLVRAQPRVAHEVEREVVLAGRGGRSKLELDLGRLCEGDALDGEQGVGPAWGHSIMTL